MTAAVRAQLLAAGVKVPNPAPVQRTAPRPASAPPAPNEARRSEKTPERGISALAQREYYPHPYHVQVANGTHYPSRVRIVITGPASEELPAALVAAITELLEKP